MIKPWNKNKKCPSISKARQGMEFSQAHKEHLSQSHLGQIPWNKGKKISQVSGEKHWNWQGGKYRERQSLSSLEYRQWREKIFQNDNFSCRLCEQKGGKLVAHHLESWSRKPELRYNLDNGITLCEKCHKKVHSKKLREKAISALKEIFLTEALLPFTQRSQVLEGIKS